MVGPPLLVMRKVALIRKRFIKKGAVSASTALTLKELGLRKGIAFHLMHLKGHIMEVNGRYYFNNENWDGSVAKKLNEFAVSFLKDIEQDDEIEKEDDDEEEEQNVQNDQDSRKN